MPFSSLRVLVVTALLFTIHSAKAQVIADALPGCLAIANTVGVSCDGGSTQFGINAFGQFEITNVDGAACCGSGGGDNNSYFEFEEINIQCFEDVMISFDYSGDFDGDDFEDDSPLTPIFGCQGSNPPDGSHDQIVFTYSLDSGPEIQSLYVHGTTAADFTGTWTAGPLNGNTLTIRVYGANKAQAEHFYFENLVIEANATSASAGDDFTYCGDGPIPLDGSGEGTWSGGLGTFSDPTDPNSTYDPAPSEFGTTVTLTFGGCSATSSCASADVNDEVEVTIYSGATASIDQDTDGELCFGECTTIKFDFVGGTEPYDLDLTFTISGVGFPINFNAPGFATNDGIIICYDITGIFPSYDPGSQTINVPEIAAGLSGTFTLNGFTDANGCEGTVGGMGFSVSFLDTPEANFASLEACDEGGGMATFDLTEMDNDVNGGSGETVNYYDDPGLTNEVFSPYISPTSVLYATVSNADCTSEPEEVEVIVLDNGDAGIVEFYCSEIGNTTCTICDDDGEFTEMITVIFVFNDPTLEHIVTLDYTEGGSTTQGIYTLAPNQTTLTFTINQLTTIQITEVIEGDECPDNTDLGDLVTINYLISPLLDDIGPLTECGSVTLPPITGTGLTGTELYYTMPNQGGDSYAPGAMITSTTDLYVYAGTPECFDEIQVEIEILPGTSFENPNDTIHCGPYILPEIEGTNVGSTAAYYTLPNGNGNIFIPGNIILTSTDLYIFDPLATCLGNEPFFSITINAIPEFNLIDDVDTCGIYILPDLTGTTLTGDQSYFTEANGMGLELNPGDTIFVSDTIYAYDNNFGCLDQLEIEIIIDEGPTAGVGDTISICGMIPEILNLPALLSTPADTSGRWSDDMGIIMDDTDSTSVDVTGIVGTINFMYVIENMVCGNDTSHLQVNLQQQIDAGGEDLLFGCETEINFINLNAFWNITGVDDTIIVPLGSGISVTDPSNVDLSNVDPGAYIFQYIVGITDTICMPDTANLEIQIEEAPDAGEEITTSTCLGNLVNLELVLQGNNQVGTFDDPNSTGALTGSIVDTDILGEGSFVFTHTVAASGNCPAETIQITLLVTNDVTAGESVIDTICFTEEVNLFDYLVNASSGGIFLDADNGNTEIPSGILTIDAWPTLPAGTPIMTTALYEVGDGVDCPISTSTVELLILPEPEISLDAIQSTICDSLLDVEINYTYLEGFDFTIIIDGALPELPISIPYSGIDPDIPASDVLNIQINLNEYNLPGGMDYTITIGSITRDDCITTPMLIPDNFSIGQKDTLFVNDAICGNESVTIDGQVFNASNPTGEILIPRTGQCDSLILIDLNIQDPSVSFINSTLCTGQFIVVNGQIFDETNPSGDAIFFDMAANGCDSIVTVNLTFGDASINDVVQDLCTGEELLINGILYDENNLMGSDTIFGGSVGGCDSIINVNLTPITTEVGMIVESPCDPLFNVTVNGQVFDFDNPMGTVNIPGGSVSGCDSIVDVNLTFLDPSTSIEDGSICPGESIIVNGNTYDENMLTGFEIFPSQAANGCDSIVNINLTLLEIPEGPFTINSCDLDFEFPMNGNVYNFNNPMGTELIEGGATNGCDSIANIQLLFDGISAESIVTEPDCNTSDGSVTISNISGVAPFFIVEGDVLVEITELPYTIDGLSGMGEIELIDSDGCETQVAYSINEFIAPILTYDINENQINISGISLEEINSIEWNPSDGLSCTDCLNPTYDVEQDIDYQVNINYGTDCIAQVTIPVMAEQVPIIPVYHIPNVFSPNGDGNNDIFFILPGNGASNQVASMTIFDRWGNQLYRKENYVTAINEGWDGTFQGQELNPGVYVYVIEILEGETIKPFYGDITIVK